MKVAISLAGGLLSSSLASAAFTKTRAASVNSCLNSKDVPIVLIEDPEYADLAEPFNLRLQYKPAVIVMPTTEQHVQDAVKCAEECGLKVQAKSGGHSYASYSSGGKDGSMMIDLQSFQTVEVGDDNVAKVGGGLRLGNLAKAIYDQGERALSHGTCPGVGIGGHFTHGGYGHTSRNWGLAMDSIVACDVVLANGTLVHATSTENSEVFWGVRGAAESLGIVTTFYLETQPAPESVTYWSFQWEGMFTGDSSKFTSTWLHLQDFAKNDSVVDSRISFGTYMDGKTAFSTSGLFFGSVDEFNSDVKPELLRGLAEPKVNTVEAYGWIDYLILVGEKDDLEEPVSGYDEHDNFFAKSVTVPEEDGLTKEAWDALYEQMTSDESVSYFVIINLYGGPGSAINSKDTEFAAYHDRDSLWVLQNYGMEASSIDFINGINSAIIDAQPETHFGAYLNYVDPSYSAEEAHELYYGEELYSKLEALKKKLDPKNTFWNPQSIGA